VSKRLSRKKVQNLVRESVRQKIIFESFSQTAQNTIIELDELGYSRNQINEGLADILTNFVKMMSGRAVGAGATGSTISGEEAGYIDQFKLLITEKVIDTIMGMFNIDPDSLIGSMIRDTLKNCIQTLEWTDIKRFLKDDQCDEVARELAGCILDGLKRGVGSKLIGSIAERIFDQDVSELRSGITGSFYKTINDKLTKAIRDAFDSPELVDTIAEEICKIDAVEIFNKIKPGFTEYAGDFLDTMKNQLGFDNLNFAF